ncbi:hypothetical protein ACU4GD_42275 [Cupriavidus basilensis]
MNEARSGSLLDFIEDFTNRFPKYVDEYETLLTDNRDLETAPGRHRCGEPGTRAANGLYRPDAARLRHRVGPAQEAALRSV